MKNRRKNNGLAPLEIPEQSLSGTRLKLSLTGRSFLTGSAFLLVIFVIALLSAVVMGILQINTEEIQLMQNQIYAAQALATAEAGLNDAFAELRADANWIGPIVDEPFGGGTYDVNVGGTLPNLTITSTGASPQSFVARVQADVTVGSVSPHVVRIDNLRINE